MIMGGGDGLAQRYRWFISPRGSGSILSIPKNHFDVVDIYWRHRLAESGQGLDNVDRNKLVVAR